MTRPSQFSVIGSAAVKLLSTVHRDYIFQNAFFVRGRWETPGTEMGKGCVILMTSKIVRGISRTKASNREEIALIDCMNEKRGRIIAPNGNNWYDSFEYKNFCPHLSTSALRFKWWYKCTKHISHIYICLADCCDGIYLTICQRWLFLEKNNFVCMFSYKL